MNSTSIWLSVAVNTCILKILNILFSLIIYFKILPRNTGKYAAGYQRLIVVMSYKPLVFAEQKWVGTFCFKRRIGAERQPHNAAEAAIFHLARAEMQRG